MPPLGPHLARQDSYRTATSTDNTDNDNNDYLMTAMWKHMPQLWAMCNTRALTFGNNENGSCQRPPNTTASIAELCAHAGGQ